MRYPFLFFSFLLVVPLFGQESGYQMPGYKKEVEASFLSSYYNQDGDNAAVTGGIGTEELTDFSNIITVNIPLDTVQALNLQVGADYYTSASTDNIDNNPSSASSEDIRAYTNIAYSRLDLKRGLNYSVRGGFSIEYDYVSINGGLGIGKEWNEGNTTLQFNVQAFFDTWDLIFPIELRIPPRPEVVTDQRRSFNGSLFFSQILNQRLSLGISAEITYMEGLLSTPFHRVYFTPDELDIERLPGERIKIPLSVRFNYFPFDNVILRSWYRFYTDDFGINAHTVELEVPVKIGTDFVVGPYYRYHTQTTSEYFAPFAAHTASEEFYTSDYDLSELSSHKVGLGLRYSPVFGIARSKMGQRVAMFKYIELRGAYYSRSTELTAMIVSLGLGMTLK